MKTLVISDIHGYYRELNDALHNADYREGDRLIFLGDYIDRGPRSRELPAFLRSVIPPEHPAFIGNTHYSFETDAFSSLHEQRGTDFVWGTDGFFLKQGIHVRQNACIRPFSPHGAIFYQGENRLGSGHVCQNPDNGLFSNGHRG